MGTKKTNKTAAKAPKAEAKKPSAVKNAEVGKCAAATVSIEDIKQLIEFAAHARFLLLTIVPTPKKGTRAEKIMKAVVKTGPFIAALAKVFGVNLPFGEAKIAKEKPEAAPAAAAPKKDAKKAVKGKKTAAKKGAK